MVNCRIVRSSRNVQRETRKIAQNVHIRDCGKLQSAERFSQTATRARLLIREMSRINGDHNRVLRTEKLIARNSCYIDVIRLPVCSRNFLCRPYTHTFTHAVPCEAPRRVSTRVIVRVCAYVNYFMHVRAHLVLLPPFSGSVVSEARVRKVLTSLPHTEKRIPPYLPSFSPALFIIPRKMRVIASLMTRVPRLQFCSADGLGCTGRGFK